MSSSTSWNSEVQRGTGDAARIGLVGLPEDDEGDVLILPGDTPLLTAWTIEALVEAHRSSGDAGTLLTSVVARSDRLRPGDT